jgi:hypothetical protein
MVECDGDGCGQPGAEGAATIGRYRGDVAPAPGSPGRSGGLSVAPERGAKEGAE